MRFILRYRHGKAQLAQVLLHPAQFRKLREDDAATETDDAIGDLFARSRHDEPTDHTVRSIDGLLDAIRDVRRTGWAMVDQELELGVRSIAAPIHNKSGCTVAAVNVSTQVGRTDLHALIDQFVPALLSTAAQIDAALGMR